MHIGFICYRQEVYLYNNVSVLPIFPFQFLLLHSITKTTRIVCFCILCYCNYQCPVEMEGHFCFKRAPCSPLARWVMMGIDWEIWGVIMGYNVFNEFQWGNMWLTVLDHQRNQLFTMHLSNSQIINILWLFPFVVYWSVITY